MAPVGAIKCSAAPLLPKRPDAWSSKNKTSDEQWPKVSDRCSRSFHSLCSPIVPYDQLNDVIGHPGIKDALDLIDEGPPSWSWWRESVEELGFEKEARELEKLDSGDNDTIARLVRQSLPLLACATHRCA